MSRSKLRDSKRNVHELINSASNGSDLDLSPRENLFIILLILIYPKIKLLLKVSKGAKIRNRYNQVPHLTKDTNEKVTNS